MEGASTPSVDLHPAGGNFGLADMDQAIEEGAGGQHHLAAENLFAVGGDEPRRPFRPLKSGLPRSPHGFPDWKCCAAWIALLRGRARGRPGRAARAPPALAAIEQAKLDARRIRDPAHQPVQGIDLAHQMALAHPADGGIAGHLAQGLELMGEQQGAGAKARRSRRRFAAGMAAADDDDVVGFMRGSIARHPQACATAASCSVATVLTCRCRNRETQNPAAPRHRPGR